MFKPALIALGALMLATPALAQAEGEGKPAPAETKDAKAKLYCVKQPPITGSIMPQKICKTRDKWLEEDHLDPLNFVKK